MRIGLQIPSFSWDGGAAVTASKLADIAGVVDQGGFYSLWAMDHFFQIPGVGEPQEDMYEGYSTLTYLAALTKTVKLGTLVTGVIYRYPGLLVKTVTTLDVLSGGRAYFGIGAAWFEREALGLGVPYPSTAERFERLEETLQIAHQMWAGESKPFQGKHYQLDEAMARPLPLSQPHPPILIGGMGENKTMRLIAQYGDACNFFANADKATIQARLDTIKRNCDEIGRDYNAIEKTVIDTVDFTRQTPAEIVAKCHELAGMGFAHVIFNVAEGTFAGADVRKGAETLSSAVIPEVAAL
ncbi:MAG: LLM class F420-dependent oxidoreductase [bacterium]|nr:LLM class F420-dependent oxidoreductase [bacterium]